MTGSVLPEQKKPSPLVQLRQQMTEAYSLEELRTLCFDLEVNFDELPHLLSVR